MSKDFKPRNIHERIGAIEHHMSKAPEGSKKYLHLKARHGRMVNESAKSEALKGRTKPDHTGKDCGYKCVFHNKGVKHIQ